MSEFKSYIVKLLKKMKRVLDVVNENIETATKQLGELEALVSLKKCFQVPSELEVECEKKIMCNVPHFLVIEQSFPDL